MDEQQHSSPTSRPLLVKEGLTNLFEVQAASGVQEGLRCLRRARRTQPWYRWSEVTASMRLT
jgi:hypothetical protein